MKNLIWSILIRYPLVYLKQNKALREGVIEPLGRRPWSKARHPTHTLALCGGVGPSKWSCGSSGASVVNWLYFAHITQIISDSCRSLVSSDIICIQSASILPAILVSSLSVQEIVVERQHGLSHRDTSAWPLEFVFAGPASQVTVDKYMLDSSAIHWFIGILTSDLTPYYYDRLW